MVGPLSLYSFLSVGADYCRSATFSSSERNALVSRFMPASLYLPNIENIVLSLLGDAQSNCSALKPHSQNASLVARRTPKKAL
jgi:hypothetical protein